MFIDKVKIYIKAGDGGDGKISFRREKYIPNGGPDGGDGGNGGSVIFIADSSMRTLMDFRYKRKHIAEIGQTGGAKNCYGKSGDNLYIKVPVGTVIIDGESKRALGDLRHEDQELMVAKGGRGGKGNAQFATSTRQTPRFAQPGEKGEEMEIEMELKLIADVGLVGFPNVGKSTLLSVVSAATPKIANYHFTTLSPNLGVVELDSERNFVMADIPGLIEGAHEGVGLGHDFLRHIERTKVIIHVLDVSGTEGRDPIEDFRKINNELRLYSEKLASKPQVVACNKMDIPDSEKNFERVRLFLPSEGYDIFPVSGATKMGIKPMLDRVYNILETMEGEEEIVEVDKDLLYHKYTDKKDFEIRIENDIYVISGPLAERLLASVNMDDSDSVKYFQRVIRKRGIIDELKSMGINDGDTVKMGSIEFEYYD
ncbi:MAG: GTPase ObgE [Lutispora sp.]|nr:GTPase ObgE [Lutispora sp.]